jgi:signal transduction histidine kinase
MKASLLQQIARAADIVETTLRLTQPKERKEVELNLNEVIEDALKLYQPIGVKLTKELGPLPPIKGDFEDLRLVFVNLIKNAREAISDAGVIRIKTYPSIDNEQPFVCAEVSDNGTGIPKENLERIFEPFFSTHVTKGRGLGLSIVFRIIREHLGKIEVSSEVGAGSTFKVQLPALRAAPLL